MNIPRTPRAVKSASTNPYWCQLLLMYYISTTTYEFHYTLRPEKPSITRNVHVVCASSQWDAYLITYSERKFIRDCLRMGHWGNSSVEVQGTAPTNHLVLLARSCCSAVFLSYRHHNFQIIPQQCLLSEIIL